MTPATNDLPVLSATFRDGVQKRLHLGMQVYVSVDGQVVIDSAFGHAEHDVDLNTDHRMLWLSSGKPLTAAAIMRFWQRGLLQLDDPVTKWIPEFGKHGKEVITVRHLLTHTAGIRQVPTHWQHDEWNTIIDRICDAELESGWIVGESAGYHVASSWFVLGELLQRISAKPFVEVLREDVLVPCGMEETICGLSDSDATPPAESQSGVYRREKGELGISPYSDPELIRKPAPGANTWGPASDLGRFYESILFALRNRNSDWLQPMTAEAMTARHRTGIHDQTLQHVVDYGLGVIANSAMYGVKTVPYGFGEKASAASFGHGGAQSSLGYCDPRRGLVVVAITNGMAGEPQNHRRNLQLMQAIEAELERKSALS